MLPVPACGSKTRRWHSHRSACSAVAPGGRTPNRNRGRPCSWPSGRSPRPPPPQSALSVFAAATRPPTAASGSQSSDRSVENCSLPGYHQGASRWRYSTPANPIKSDRLLGDQLVDWDVQRDAIQDVSTSCSQPPWGGRLAACLVIELARARLCVRRAIGGTGPVCMWEQITPEM